MYAYIKINLKKYAHYKWNTHISMNYSHMLINVNFLTSILIKCLINSLLAYLISLVIKKF